jgi:hypothetical protein
MGVMINYLKSHPDIDEVAGLRAEALYTVLAEVEVVNVLGCTRGAELASYMQQHPNEEGLFIFFSDELIWLLRLGPDAVLWLTQNPRAMRTFIEGVEAPEPQKTMLLELMDKVILHFEQQANN